MIERRATRLSRVIPDSETAYSDAINDAIQSLIYELSELQRGYTKNSPDNTWTSARLKFMIDSLSQELGVSTDIFIKDFKKEMLEIIFIDNRVSIDELELMVNLGHIDNEPSPYTIISVSKSKLMNVIKTDYLTFSYLNSKDKKKYSSISVRSLYANTKHKTIEVVRSILTSGSILGLSPDVIASQLRPVSNDVEHMIRTTVRTLLADASNKADTETMRRNKKFISLYQFIGVLDTRTSSICRSLDGQRWRDVPKVFQPPLHPNCRSKLAPIPYGFKHGTRPVVLSDGTVKIVDADITYKELAELEPELRNKKFINLEEYKRLMNQPTSKD